MKTPTFVINSLYNFGEWAMLAPQYNGSFPPDSGTPPPDWQQCYPGNGALTPTSYVLPSALRPLPPPLPRRHGLRPRRGAPADPVSCTIWGGSV